MKTSDKGIELMHKFEGYRDKPYQCSASMWTIGWGHVIYQDQIKYPLFRPNGKTTADIPMIRSEYPLKIEHNRVWSKDELVKIFKDDLVSFERGVLRLAPNLAGRQGAFDACVAFSFNVGLGNFQKSTIRMKINRGEWDAAAESFMQWTKAGGKVLKGLVRRREAEVALFKADLDTEEQ
jgi:lysozyme